MRTLTRLIAAAALAGTLALTAATPLLALDTAPVPDAAGGAAQEADVSRDVVTPLVWTLVGTGLFCGALGALYLLKRELGGFTLRPGAWTAPISVIPSRTLAIEESDFPDPADNGHCH